MDKAAVFNQIVEERRSVRKYDTTHEIDKSVVEKSLKRAILSANSSNMQIWEFYRITSEKAKQDMVPLCLGQNAAKTANELVVFVARPDLWKDRQQKLLKHFNKIMPDKTERKAQLTYKYYEEWIPSLYDLSKPKEHDEKMNAIIEQSKDDPTMRDIYSRDVDIIAHKSVALAAQTFMLSIKAEGYDTCPMEGIDSAKMKEYLNLPKEAGISIVVSVGKGIPSGIYGERFRIPFEDVVFEL